MSHDLDAIRDRLRHELRLGVPESVYEIWLAPLEIGSFDGRELILTVPAPLRSIVAQRFGRLLDATVAAVLDPSVELHVAGAEASDGDDPRRGSRARDRAQATAGRTGRGRFPPAAGRDDGPAAAPLNPKLSFEQFVIGDANRFAHAAALAVAENPAHAYNPLFVYGPPGVGKSHLLHAIGNYVARYGEGLTVRCTTAENFTNAFLAAIHGGDVERFKSAHREIDVLLIDDVQFLESKAKTEEEFFHTFNALYDTGSQLVLTSDRTPQDLDALHDRLRERFESGLVTDIASPDRATRLAVLRKRVDHDGVVIAEDGALDAIADRVTTNVRALEGALIRVVAFASLQSEPITADLAETVLAKLYPRERRARPLDVSRIQELVCDAFGLSREELLGRDRSARVSWPRQLAMYLAREHTGESLPAIGKAFGGKDHSTVLYAVRRTGQRMKADPEAYDTVADLTRRLMSGDDDRDD